MQQENKSSSLLKIAFSVAIVVLLSGASVAIAAITFSNTSITGDSSFNAITGATSTTIDVGSGSTLSIQTTNNGPITAGSGLFTIGGALTVNGTFTAGGPKIALSNFATSTAGNVIVVNASNVPTYVALAGDISSVSATGSVALAASNGNLTTLSAISSIDRSGTITIGNTNGTTITIGRSGQIVSFPGNASTTGTATFLSALTQSGGTASLATTTVAGSLTINGGAPILKHLSATSSITFGVIATSSCATQTMTVTGANAGDNVYAAPTPVAGGIETVGASWSAYASSTNTIAIKACNPTTANTASIAAEVWRADVWQH